MTKKLKRPLAFFSAFVMGLALLLYFPSGTFSNIDWGIKASAVDITPSAPTEGNGSSDNPYKIGTAAELYWFAQQVNGGNIYANAVLTENITVNDNVLNENGELNSGTFNGWTPIGNLTNSYQGEFDGQGHTISGLYCNSGSNDIGLFGYVFTGGKVSNVGLINSYIKGRTYVGGVCGELGNAKINNCYSTAFVTGNGCVGGICGLNSYSIITNCYNTGLVSSTGSEAGSVCGHNGGTTKNCYYLDTTAADGSSTAKTTEQFNSGEVAYLLSQGCTVDIRTGFNEITHEEIIVPTFFDGSVWGQTLGENGDSYPVLGGAKVYCSSSDTGISYFNSSENPENASYTVTQITYEMASGIGDDITELDGFTTVTDDEAKSWIEEHKSEFSGTSIVYFVYGTNGTEAEVIEYEPNYGSIYKKTLPVSLIKIYTDRSSIYYAKSNTTTAPEYSSKVCTAPELTGIDGTLGVVDFNQYYPNLFDNDTSTKWCVSEIDDYTNGIKNGENVFVTFRTDTPVKPVGYSITNANDNSNYTNRKPLSWTLYGSNSESGSWTQIAKVTDDNTIKAVNYKQYDFTIDNLDTAYQYYKFELNKVAEEAGENAGVIQMSEFNLICDTDIQAEHNIDANSAKWKWNQLESGDYEAGLQFYCNKCGKTVLIKADSITPVSSDNGTEYHAYVDIDGCTYEGIMGQSGVIISRKPEFKTQSLILSGKIGANFYLDLSSLTDEEKNASYMEFTVNGKTVIDEFDSQCINDTGEYYGFTCYVNSVQMEENIHAVFHYRGGKTIEKDYKVSDYINTIDNSAGSYYITELVHAIADYGYHMQKFLSVSNNWTIGTDYAEQTKYYNDSFGLDSVMAAVEDEKFVYDLGQSDIEKVTYSLSLNADTSINVYLKGKENYDGDVTVTVNGNTVQAVKQSDGRWKIVIPNIPAHMLGAVYNISVTTTNGTADCSVSALSYVRSVLNSDSFNDTAKNAVASLYYYYAATMEYSNANS